MFLCFLYPACWTVLRAFYRGRGLGMGGERAGAGVRAVSEKSSIVPSVRSFLHGEVESWNVIDEECNVRTRRMKAVSRMLCNFSAG